MQNISLIDIISFLESAPIDIKNKISAFIKNNNSYDKIVNIINSLADLNHNCPYCKSNIIRKFGKTPKGLQRFQCKNCGKTYNSLTGTALAHLHKREQWINMAKALRNHDTIDQTAKRCGTAHSTAFRWRHRFIQTSANDMSSSLDGIVEADETYFRCSHKGLVIDGVEGRKRGGPLKNQPGLSKSLVGVVVAVDRLGGVIDGILNDNSTKSISSIIKGKLAATVKLCIDGGSALWGFVQKNKIPFAVMPSGKYVSEYDPCFHIQTVNSYHSHLKTWITRFRGVATKYLQNYLGWFRKLKTTRNDLTDYIWIESSIKFNINHI